VGQLPPGPSAQAPAPSPGPRDGAVGWRPAETDRDAPCTLRALAPQGYYDVPKVDAPLPVGACGRLQGRGRALAFLTLVLLATAAVLGVFGWRGHPRDRAVHLGVRLLPRFRPPIPVRFQDLRAASVFIAPFEPTGDHTFGLDPLPPPAWVRPTVLRPRVPVPLAAARTLGLAALGLPPVLLLGNVMGHLEGPLALDFAAGLFAAFCATCVMYPVDTLKTRAQLGRPSVPGEGLRQLYRGLPFALAKDCPAAAVYITACELAKSSFAAPTAGDPLLAFAFFLVLLLCGCVGDLLASVFTLPMELILKPIQAGQVVAIPAVFRAHGLSGILGCWKMVLMRDMPMGALQLAVFESLKPFAPVFDGPCHVPHFGTMMMLGAVAGAVSAFFSTPCDLLTSRMMMQKGKKGSVVAALREVYAEGGPRGLFKGAWLRTCYFAPECCIFFAVFEALTSVINP